MDDERRDKSYFLLNENIRRDQYPFKEAIDIEGS